MLQKFVTVGSYLVATDGIMQDLFDVPRGKEDWNENNPVSAVKEFLSKTRILLLSNQNGPSMKVH